MKNGKYCNKKSLNKKPLALLLALTLLVGCAVGGTIAWLTSETDDVENTFTVGDINIELKEYDLIVADGGYDLDESKEVNANNDYKFVPGDNLPKDPFVKVKEGSEKCYLFIKVKVANNSATDNDNAEGTTPASVQNILSWTVEGQDTNPANSDPAVNWVAYAAGDDETNGVKCYYRVVEKQPVSDNGTDDYAYFHILNDDEVIVSENVVKEVVDEINDAKPMLTFDAAAVQFDNIADVNAAFAKIVWAD